MRVHVKALAFHTLYNDDFQEKRGSNLLPDFL